MPRSSRESRRYEYYAAPAGHQCASSLLPGQTVLYFSPTQAGTSEDRGAVTTSSVLDPTQIICDGIPIWWQASDAAVLSAASDITSAISSLSTTTAQSVQAGATTSGAASTRDSSFQPASSTSSTGKPQTSSSKFPSITHLTSYSSSTSSTTTSLITYTPRTGLSTNAKIAIGVTIPIVFLAILLGLFLIKKNRRLTATADDSNTNTLYANPELDGAGAGNTETQVTQQTSPAPQLQELVAQERTAELAATISGPHELGVGMHHELY